MLKIEEGIRGILGEINGCLTRVSAESMEQALQDIAGSQRIFLMGAGRSGLAIRGFAMRLMHLGKNACLVGETITPPIGPGDLLIIGSGSGRTLSLLALAAKAKKIGARILLLTIDSGSPIAQLADRIIEIPAASPKIDRGGETTSSMQPMGSLFEQCLFLLLDALVLVLARQQGISPEEMFARHANME